MASTYELQQIYLAYFGRPADADGISFYASTPVASVVKAFSASPESQSLYGTVLSTVAVKAIYTYLFNRPAADSEAAFWVTVVNAPNSAISPAAAALTILQSAHNADLTGITNKMQVASNFTYNTAGYSGAQAAAAARQFLSTVDSTQASLSTALDKVSTHHTGVGTAPVTPIVPVVPILPILPYVPPPPGSIQFGLTANSDVFVGASADDTVSGALGGSSPTYTAGDSFDGGAGMDTLSLYSYTGSYTLDGSRISNIEKLAIANGSTSAVVTVDAQSVHGLTAFDSGGGGGTLTVSLAGSVDLSLRYTNAATTVKVAASALTGNADAITLSVTAAAGAVLTLTSTAPAANEFETLNLVSRADPFSGTVNALTLATDSIQTSLKTLNVSGAAPLSLFFATDHTSANLTIIDASGTTGGITIGAEGGSVLGSESRTITLGTGNDTLYFGNNLVSGITIDGGAGIDTLGVSSAVSHLNNVRNVEVLRFDISGGGIVQDASAIGISGLSYVANGGSSLTLNNLSNNASTTLLANTAALTETLSNSTGANDSLTVVLGNTADTRNTTPVTLGSLNGFSGVEHVNIVSTKGGYYSSANQITSDTVTAPHVITGDNDLTISTQVAARSIDASGLNARLSISIGDGGANLRTGAGSDSIVLAGGSDTVDSGAGDDTIFVGGAGQASTGPSGADVITTGSGSDAIYLSTDDASGTGNATSYSVFAEIKDFSVGFDRLGSIFGMQQISLKNAAGSISTGVSGQWGYQNVAQNSTITSAFSFFKLASPVAFHNNVATSFADAIGTGSITGLNGNGNYIVSMYDSTHAQMVVAVVNTGANAAGNSVLSAADFTATGVSVIGVLDMIAPDYAAFGYANVR